MVVNLVITIIIHSVHIFRQYYFVRRGWGTYLPPVKQEPFAPPNVENTTAIGIIIAAVPRTLSPQV